MHEMKSKSVHKTKDRMLLPNIRITRTIFFGRRHRRRRLSFYIPDKITEYKYSLFIRNQLHMNNNYGTLVHVFIVIYDSSLDPTDGENIFRTKKK